MRFFVCSFLTIVFTSLLGCTQLPVKPNTIDRIRLKYRLTDTVRSFEFERRESSVRGKLMRNHETLTFAKNIASQEFESLIQEMALVVKKSGPNSSVNCRHPFEIELIGKEEHLSKQGCRQSESFAELSRLIKRAEFLILASSNHSTGRAKE